MPIYHRLGEIPPKRHQVMPRDDGSMHFEQLIGNKGFVGPSSLLYHINYPTEIHAVRALGSCALQAVENKELRLWVERNQEEIDRLREVIDGSDDDDS